MFQFREFASICMDIPTSRDGLPHSDIHGSTLLCSSPWLFAAWHVLHRHCMPRHPPYALFYFSLAWLAQLLHKHTLTLIMSSIFFTSIYFNKNCRMIPHLHAQSHTTASTMLNTSKNSPGYPELRNTRGGRPPSQPTANLFTAAACLTITMLKTLYHLRTYWDSNPRSTASQNQNPHTTHSTHSPWLP